jgi:hypothetical protein
VPFAQKKGPRSQRVPGGLRTHRFPGAIGRSAAARPCAPCPQAATLLTKRLRQPPCRRPAPRSAETCPKARSRCGLATWPHQVFDLGRRRSAASLAGQSWLRAMGGKIFQAGKGVKSDFLRKIRGNFRGKRQDPFRKIKDRNNGAVNAMAIGIPSCLNIRTLRDRFHEEKIVENFPAQMIDVGGAGRIGLRVAAKGPGEHSRRRGENRQEL